MHSVPTILRDTLTLKRVIARPSRVVWPTEIDAGNSPYEAKQACATSQQNADDEARTFPHPVPPSIHNWRRQPKSNDGVRTGVISLNTVGKKRLLAACLTVALAVACASPQPQPSSQATLPQPTSGSATTLPSVEPSNTPGPDRAWLLDQGSAFGPPSSTPYGVVGVPLGDLILGAIDDRAAVWIRSDDREWSIIPLRGEATSSRAVAAAGGDDHVLVAVRDEEGKGSELWLLAGGGWRKIVAPGSFPPGWAIRAIIWTGQEYVAVGFVSEGDPTTSIEGAVAASWSSSDGIAWNREELNGPARGSWLTSVATTGDGVLAGGQVLRGTSDGLLLLRRDGDWQIPDVPKIAQDQDEVVLKVLRQTANWYVAGRVSPPECAQSGCVTRTARAWTSRDGDEWTTTDLDASVPSAFDADGTSIYGLRQDSGADAVFVASSSDGIKWSDVTDGHAMPVGASLQTWGRSSQGFILVGTDPQGRLLVWEWR